MARKKLKEAHFVTDETNNTRPIKGMQPNPKFTSQKGGWFFHKYVKFGFDTLDNRKEYMWAAITCYKGNILHGVLVNDPTLPMNLKCGDVVMVPISGVIDVIEEPVRRDN